MLTHERLLELLTYDPETGHFTRKIRTSSRAPQGSIAGSLDRSHGYFLVSVDAKEYYAHRLAWFYVTSKWPEHQIDHRNGDRADNRFANLREATQAQNKKNSRLRANNTSGRKGVTWHAQAGKWLAQIQANGKRKSLGLFSDLDAAAECYQRAARELHGEFANAEGK